MTEPEPPLHNCGCFIQKAPPDVVPPDGPSPVGSGAGMLGYVFGGGPGPIDGSGAGMLGYVFGGGPGPIDGSGTDISDPGPTDFTFNLAQASVCI